MHNGTLYYAKADNYVPSNFPIETHTKKEILPKLFSLVKF